MSTLPVDRVNGAALYWERRGSGPRLLFCNGSGLTLHDVRPLLDPLTASFDLLAWDYRGFGRSAPVAHPHTMADVATDAAGLLEVTGWQSCRVIGASFGGMVAQEFTVTHPQRVERLALACTSAGGEGGSSYPLQKLLELPPGRRAAAELKVVDSRWDQRWLEAHPADRAIAEGMTAAGQDQQDPAAMAAYQAQLQARRSGLSVDEHTIELAGSPVFYRTATGPGAPVLYVHGVPTSSDDWIPFLERTGGIAPDLIGFGRSGKAGNLDYSVGGISDFLARLLAELDVGPIRLVVHDWGAPIGL